MTHEPLRLLVISAGLSTPSSTRMLGDQLAGAARSALEAHGAETVVTAVELRDIAHEITDAMLTRFPGERLQVVIEQLRAADAVIAVTPIFNTAASGLFTSFLAAVDMELWRDKPVLLGATAGTARHSLALEYSIRPMFQYLKARVTPTAVFAASSDFGAASRGEAAEESLISRSRRAGGELAAMIRTGTPHSAPKPRTSGTTESEAEQSSGLDAEFAEFVPMGQMLRR